MSSPSIRASSLPQPLQSAGRREQDSGSDRACQAAGNAGDCADGSRQSVRCGRAAARGEGGGIIPIVGLEAYVAPGHRAERGGGGVSGQEHAFHLTLLARDATGFRNLMRLSSLSFLEGFYYKPRIDKEILERHSQGLICLSGCASAEFSDYILHGKMERSRAAVRVVSEGLRRRELLRRDPGQRGWNSEGMRRRRDRHCHEDGPSAGRARATRTI